MSETRKEYKKTKDKQLDFKNEQAEGAGMQVQDITVEELDEFKKNHPEAILLDVREEWEYEREHIPGTTHLPLGDLSDKVNTLDQNTIILCVCQSGVRSMNAARFLLDQEFLHIYNLKGGTKAWLLSQSGASDS